MALFYCLLYSGVTKARFQLCGTVPCWREAAKTDERQKVISEAMTFKSFPGILFGLGDLDKSRPRSRFLTPL